MASKKLQKRIEEVLKEADANPSPAVNPHLRPRTNPVFTYNVPMSYLDMAQKWSLNLADTKVKH